MILFNVRIISQFRKLIDLSFSATSDVGVEMGTNTEDELDNAFSKLPPMFSVGTSPPTTSNNQNNNHQVVVYNNNNNSRPSSGAIPSPNRPQSRRISGASPMAQSPSTPNGAPSCPFGTSPSTMEGPIVFEAPELPVETLLPAAHNETMSKLTYIQSLVDCVIDVAKTRATPISYLTLCNNNINDNQQRSSLKNKSCDNVANNNEVNHTLNNNQTGKKQFTTNSTTTDTSTFPTHQLCTLSGRYMTEARGMIRCKLNLNR